MKGLSGRIDNDDIRTYDLMEVDSVSGSEGHAIDKAGKATKVTQLHCYAMGYRKSVGEFASHRWDRRAQLPLNLLKWRIACIAVIGLFS